MVITDKIQIVYFGFLTVNWLKDLTIVVLGGLLILIQNWRLGTSWQNLERRKENQYVSVQ